MLLRFAIASTVKGLPLAWGIAGVPKAVIWHKGKSLPIQGDIFGSQSSTQPPSPKAGAFKQLAPAATPLGLFGGLLRFLPARERIRDWSGLGGQGKAHLS